MPDDKCYAYCIKKARQYFPIRPILGLNQARNKWQAYAQAGYQQKPEDNVVYPATGNPDFVLVYT